MSEVLAQLEKKGGSQVPYTVSFIARDSGDQCYGNIAFDATKIKKVHFTISVNNANTPNDTDMRYCRAYVGNQIVARFTGTGAKELVLNPSWGTVQLTVYCSSTAAYGRVLLANITTD